MRFRRHTWITTHLRGGGAAAVVALVVLAVPALDASPSSGLGTKVVVSISPPVTYVMGWPGHSATVSATVRNGATPVPDVPVSWSATGNLGLSSSTTVTDANGVATVTAVVASQGWGRQTITASAASSSATGAVVEYGCPQAVSVALAHPYLSSSGPMTTELTATVVDGYSPPDPVPGQVLSVTSSGDDTVGPVTDNGNGTYDAAVTGYEPGAQSLTVSVATTCPASTGSAVLTVYGPPARITVAANRASVPATGAAQPAPTMVDLEDPNGQLPDPYDPEPPIPQVTATVTDAQGDAVPGETVNFVADGGARFSGTTDHADGTYSATLAPTSTPGVEHVTALDIPARLVSSPTAVTETFGALHTAGSQILDANGVPVVLRGVNLWASIPNPYLANEFLPGSFYDAAAYSWGANVVRAPLDLDQWMHSCPTGYPDGHPGGTYDRNYRLAIEEYVRAATERGMYVILGLFNTPRFSCDTNGSGSQIMAERDTTNTKDDAPSFWKSVAGVFRSNPLVGFELYNEPHIAASDIPTGSGETTQSVWLNGGKVDGDTWSAAGMQTMYNAVRLAGATNLVFVDGVNWASTTPPALLSSPASTTYGTDAAAFNIVYAVHAYTCPNPNTGAGASNPYGCAGGITPPNPGDSCPTGPNLPAWDDPGALLEPWVAWRDANDVPVMETEFGWPGHSNPVDSCFDRQTVAFDEANGLPWAAFSWTSFITPWSLATSSTYQPTVSGVAVEQGLAANAGQSY